MRYCDLDGEGQKAVQETLGYLNYSSGGSDAKFLWNTNHLFGVCAAGPKKYKATWRMLGELLSDGLAALSGSSDAFRHMDQAEAVLRLVFDKTLQAYRAFHADLLEHQAEDALLRPLFIGRVCEAVLQQGPPWDQVERIAGGAVRALNDYLGYRPIAVLRTEQKIQPYPHEWVRPIPLYIRGVGAGVGRYQELVELALKILAAASPDILFQAFFDPDQLEELAIDPRAYDFDHPNNKRPNYVFGQWDMGRLDVAGRCRRFVVQTITLDTMLEWANRNQKGARDEALFEAAAVLAGTMLMGSGVSGNRPDAHDSTVTLNTLVQRIAAYRDAFYDGLLERLEGPHGERLRAEASELRQPFGGVRQFFNQRLAEHRAAQLKNVHLAYLYAQMGQTEAAVLQVSAVAAPSVRMMCRMHCDLTAAHRLIDEGQLDEAAGIGQQIDSLLHRAIECGALVDPWNILGFGGQYSLFPSPENSVYDHRVDELIELMGDIFAMYVELEKEAAAKGFDAIAAQAAASVERLAEWWDKYASTEVGDVEGFSGRETAESAAHVAAALGEWHRAGTAAGDLAFWRGRAEQFRSTKSYAMVVEALLDQSDPVAAMALLVQWLSQAQEIGLVEDTHSFHDLALVWLEDLWKPPRTAPPEKTPDVSRRWALTRKFLDYIEANADELWQTPRFELGQEQGKAAVAPEEPQGEEEAEWDSLFDAAYEGVSYRDSADDGVEGEMFETGQSPQDFELVFEAERIVSRLSFMATVARLWRLAASASLSAAATLPDRDEILAAWAAQAQANYSGLVGLLSTVHRYRIPPPRGTHESLVEYDRRRGIKEMLLEQIIAAAVETADAGRMLRAAMTRRTPVAGGEAWEEPVVAALHAVLRGDADAVRDQWRELTEALLREPLLYIALARGGSPHRVVASRGLQRVLCRLLAYLPRLGLLRETYWLIETVQDMEYDHPVGPGAVTEFDQLFETGCKAIVRALVESSADWKQSRKAGAAGADNALVTLLEQLTESLLRCWLAHSRGVRLSVLETVVEQHRWSDLKRFIQRYGRDIFSQRFMILGNLRAILHQGVEAWLAALEEEPNPEEAVSLLADLDGKIKRDDAVRWLSIALEAVVERYAEYVDYNTTTTQSDRGDMLFMLLDFLRIATSYDRVAWNLRPIALAHEVLVRGGRNEAALMWRSAVAERTREIADDHLKRYARLSRKYGMRLPSVYERLAERFVRPLAIDRLCSLVGPAMSPPGGEENEAFDRLQEEITPFAREVSGAGFDLPSWLEALEDEVDRIQSGPEDDSDTLDPLLNIPMVRLTLDAAKKQIHSIISEE